MSVKNYVYFTVDPDTIVLRRPYWVDQEGTIGPGIPTNYFTLTNNELVPKAGVTVTTEAAYILQQDADETTEEEVISDAGTDLDARVVLLLSARGKLIANTALTADEATALTGVSP